MKYTYETMLDGISAPGGTYDAEAFDSFYIEVTLEVKKEEIYLQQSGYNVEIIEFKVTDSDGREYEEDSVTGKDCRRTYEKHHAQKAFDKAVESYEQH